MLLDLGEANLQKQSLVLVSQISSIDKTRLGERIGALSAARVEQILAGLRFSRRRSSRDSSRCTEDASIRVCACGAR